MFLGLFLGDEDLLNQFYKCYFTIFTQFTLMNHIKIKCISTAHLFLTQLQI